MRLLLIEDDRKIANFVRRGLREAGFAVDHAENGTAFQSLSEKVHALGQGLAQVSRNRRTVGKCRQWLDDVEGNQGQASGQEGSCRDGNNF